MTTRPAEPRRPARWLVPVTVLAVLGGASAAGWHLWEGIGVGRCEVRAADRTETFTSEQADNAATIAGMAVGRGLPPRAATIALATAIQESKLRNISYGDRDSLGLFQQRPSQGWGSEAEIMDPVHSTGAFYDALVKVDGWQTGEVTKVAQAVQRSGFPEAYADHEWEGRVLASVLTGQTPEGIGCRLGEVGSQAPSAKDLATALTRETGVPARVEGDSVVAQASGSTAWAVGAWGVAAADSRGITSVTVGDRSWVRSHRHSALRWQPARTPAQQGQVVLTVG